VGAVVAISASIAGDTSQDLKTGMLLGATPRRQQMGELVGVITSAGFVAMTVLLLGRTYGFGGQELPAPQATLMKLVIDGVLAQELPWTLVGIGAGIALVAELFRIPSLPFAVGVYLPVSVMVPVFAGGCSAWGWSGAAPTAETGRARATGGSCSGPGWWAAKG
jgi:putative OPT family oligopeptide transporter